MQVSSRFLLVWGITYLFPVVAIASGPAYSSMLVAWSVTEMIRYSYFAVNLAYGGTPAFLTWLRYNTFFVLYPLGIASECWLVGRSLGPAAMRFGWFGWWGLVAVLGVYVPGEFLVREDMGRGMERGRMCLCWLTFGDAGSYILFTHMMAQRRKVMRGSASGSAQAKKAE